MLINKHTKDNTKFLIPKKKIGANKNKIVIKAKI